jgi:ribose/xylose/arabinose/galactoside ABC-type transport system permease subunit
VGTLFDVIRSQSVYILLALGLLPVIILGGVDISFVAIGALASYPVHIFLLSRGYEGGIFIYYVAAIFIGLSAGTLIGWLISTFKLGIFDLSLGMNTLIYGLVHFFVGSYESMKISPGVVGWNKWLPGSIVVESAHLFLIVVIATMHIPELHNASQYTGQRQVALRTGFNTKVYLIVFPLMGLLAGLQELRQRARRPLNLIFARICKFWRQSSWVVLPSKATRPLSGRFLIC